MNHIVILNNGVGIATKVKGEVNLAALKVLINQNNTLSVKIGNKIFPKVAIAAVAPEEALDKGTNNFVVQVMGMNLFSTVTNVEEVLTKAEAGLNSNAFEIVSNALVNRNHYQVIEELESVEPTETV